MDVAHYASIAPNRCGLYGTARELVLAEKKAGINAGIIDARIPENEPTINGVLDGYPYPKFKDDMLKASSYEWAKKADIHVRHSFIPAGLQNLGKPLVMAVHGRPESSFRLEVAGTINVNTTLMNRGKEDRYKAFICFWKEFLDIWATIVPPEKLFYVPAMVDLDYYSPRGKKFGWGEHGGNPNIVIADVWREDIIPFNMIYAALRFQQKYCPTAKIHIIALQNENLKAMLPSLAGIKKRNALGLVVPMTKKICDCYRAADILITPHVIATRSVREPLACGIPIVASSGNRFTPYTANPMDVNAFADAINRCWQDYKDSPQQVKDMARKTAEIAFSQEKAGKMVREVYERIL